MCYLAGRSSEHDFMKCPIFRETTFTSEHLSPPVAPMIEQLRRQDLGSNPVFGSARSTAQTATKRVITQEEFDRKWPTRFAGNLLYEKGNGQYVIFDGPLSSGTIPTSSGEEEDKRVSMVATVQSKFEVEPESPDSSTEWQEHMDAATSALFDELCRVKNKSRLKNDEYFNADRKRLPTRDITLELDQLSAQERELTTQLSLLLNVSESEIDDEAYERSTKEVENIRERMMAEEIQAQVQQALLRDSVSSAAIVTVPTNVAETGGNQDDSVSNFPQHSTVVPDSNTFKDGQELADEKINLQKWRSKNNQR